MTDRISEIEELIQSRERFALEADTSPKFEETTETLRYLLAHDAAQRARIEALEAEREGCTK